MAIDIIKTLLQDDLTAVNQVIVRNLDSSISLIKELGQHIINSGGKRLRPLLVLLSARALGYSGHQHVELAALVEFIHTATLLHDDVVDASELRRGNETANAIWGNEASVLVGDFLFSRAFQMMITVNNVTVMSILANATNAIATGEALQLMNRNNPDTTEAAYMQVIESKTARLFAAAAEVGAVVTAAPKSLQTAMATYGNHLGIAFQLIDDILDYSGNQTTIGKNIGDDLAEGKATLPLIYALRHSQDAQQRLIRDAIMHGGLQHLAAIQEAIASTHAIEYTYATATQQVNLAVAALAEVPDSTYRQALIQLAQFAAERSF